MAGAGKSKKDARKEEPKSFKQVLDRVHEDSRYRKKLIKLATEARNGHPQAVADLHAALMLTPRELKQLVPEGVAVGYAAWTVTIPLATAFLSCGFKTSINDHYICSKAY